MKKNLLLILFLFLFQPIYSQIKDNSGRDVPATVYFCSGEAFKLEVDDNSASSSTTFSVQDYADFESYFTGTGETDFQFLNTSRDDVFSRAESIGFKFPFYGEDYEYLAIGSNGRIVLGNGTELNVLQNLYKSDYIDRPFSSLSKNTATYAKLPSARYNEVYKTGDITRKVNLAQIFAGYTASRGASSAMQYKFKKGDDGTNNYITITFQGLIPYNQDGGGAFGSNSVFTSRIILFQDGRIIITIFDKTYYRYNALVGLQSEDATQSYIPPRTDDWDYNNEFWPIQRTSSGGPLSLVLKTGITRTPTYSWKLNGSQVSNTRFYPNSGTFSPTDGDIVETEITFSEAGILPVKDQVTFKTLRKPRISKTLTGCDVVLKIDPSTYDPALKYVWYKAGLSTPLYTDSRQEIYLNRTSDAPGDYYVKVLKPDGTECINSNSNLINFSIEKLPSPININAVCDNSETPAQTKSVNLYHLIYPKYDPASGLEPYHVYFYEGTSTTPVSDPENYPLNANSYGNLRFEVTDSNNNISCLSGGSPVYFISVADKLTFPTCSSLSTYNLKNDFESNLPSYYTFVYTYSDGSSAGDGSSVDPTKTVNVKTSVSGAACYTNTEIKFVAGTQIVVPEVPVQERCAASKNNMLNWFDLSSIKQILDPADRYDVKFYRKSDNSELSVNNGDGSELGGTNFWTGRNGDYVIYAKLFSRTNSCFGQSNDIVLRVYTKPVIKINPVILTNCAGDTVFDLTQNIADLADISSVSNPKMEYYTENNFLLDASQITDYDASALGLNPYIKMTYNVACSDIIKIELNYNPKPVAKTNSISVCDEEVFSGDDFKNQVIDNASQYDFFEKDGVTPLRPSFNLSNLPMPVEFYIENISTRCRSDLQEVTFVKALPTQLLKTETDYSPCVVTTDNWDGKTLFNLDSKKADFTQVPGASFKYYKDAARSQEITDPANFINDTPFAQTIYLKVTAPGFCPSDAIMYLKVKTATKSSTLLDKYFICNGGIIEVDAGGENNKFTWSNGTTGQKQNFTQPGIYTVTLTNDLECSYTHQFVISDENQPKIEKINQSQQQIEVIANGKYDIEYSFDGGVSWQNSNILLNPLADSYNIQVRSVLPDGEYCTGEMKPVYNIIINNVITPNGDGKNDIWYVKNLDKMEQVEISISDRYGKNVFHTVNKDLLTWNGWYNGRILPTSSYWYVVKWFDPSTQKQEIRQGWILLKNRN